MLRTAASPRHTLTVAVLALLAVTPAAEAAGNLCTPPEALEPALLELDTLFTPGCVWDRTCWEGKVEHAEALLEEHPDDLWLHLAYQDLIQGWHREGAEEAGQALRERYAARAAARPRDPVSRHLRARLLEDDAEREAAYRSLIEDHPGLPWGHHGLAATLARQLREEEGDTTPAAVEAELDRFLELCPDGAYHAVSLSFHLRDDAYWRRHLPQIRTSLRDAPANALVRGLRFLWRVEFQVLPAPEHDAARQRVAGDVEVLEALGLEQSSYWWSLLQEGYKTLGDRAALERSEARMVEALPCSQAASRQRIGAWREAQGFEGKARWMRELDQEALTTVYRQARHWVEECPESSTFSNLLFSIAPKIEELPAGELLAAIDHHLPLWERHMGHSITGYSPWGPAAEALLDHGVAVERTPGLIGRELARIEREIRERPPEEIPETFRHVSLQWRKSQHAQYLSLLVSAHLALDDLPAARETLERARAAFEELRAYEQANGDELQRRLTPARAAELWRREAELAQAEERRLDAVAYYLRALDQEGEDEETRNRAVALWEELGGSEAGWAALEDRAEGSREEAGTGIAEVTGWLTTEEPLPEFALRDLEGETWEPEDLHGKTVLVNLWATWCGPCRLELPYLQELVERLDGDPELEVVTLNADFNAALVAPFMEEEGYAFPVLLAEQFLMEMMDGLSLPQNWIVDPEGVVRLEQHGFDPDEADGWVEEMLARMESVAGGGAGG